MAILPIDIQTLLGQMGHVGKAQHNIENAAAMKQSQQGSIIHQESEQKDHQVVDLEHIDEEDKIINPDARKKREFAHKKSSKEKKEARKKKTDLFKDPEKGNIIDVKK